MLKKNNIRVSILFFTVLYFLFVILLGWIKSADNFEMKLIYEFDIDWSMENRVTFEFDSSDIQIVELDDDHDAYRHFEMFADLNFDLRDLNKVIIEIYDNEWAYRLKSLEFYNNDMQIAKYSVNDLVENFVIKSNDEYKVEATKISVEKHDTSLSMESKDEFVSDLKEKINSSLFFYWNNVLGSSVLIYVGIGTICYLIGTIAEANKRIRDKDSLMYFFAGASIVSFGLVFVMGFKSQIYAHPDENVFRMAIDYYLRAWLPAGSNSSWMAGTHSDYGVSRLSEMTVFYLLAGKMAWIVRSLFPFDSYFRMFNIFLYGILVLLCIKYGKRKPAIYMIILLSPQIWYQFGYATSDAWDFFVCSVIGIQFMDKDSILFRYLDTKTKYNWLYGFWLGVGFAVLFFGKQNYWVMLVFSFLLLTIKWVYADVSQKKYLLLKYMYILAVFLVVLFVRSEITSIVNDATEWTSDNTVAANAYERRIIQQEEGTDNSNLKEKGKSVWSIATKETFSWIYKSAVGVYLRGGVMARDWYYIIMFVLHMTIGGMAVYYAFKESNVQKKLEIVVSVLMCILLVSLLIYYCWTVINTAFGRYILIDSIFLSYILCMADKKIWKNRMFKLCVIACVVLSVYSFVCVGINNLVIS